MVKEVASGGNDLLIGAEPQNFVFSSNRTPEQSNILDKVQSGGLSLIVFQDIPLVDRGVVTAIKNVKALGKPVVVGIDAKSFNKRKERAALFEHIVGVDSVLMVNEDLWEDPELRFRSNVHLVGEKVHNERIKHKIARPYSPYLQKANEASVQNDKYLDDELLITNIQEHQRKGKKIIIASGVFDVMHAGHIEFFLEAKKRGDVLIVLTNSDFSASHQSKNVSGDRPINSLRYRVDVLSSVKEVDHVVGFDSENIVPILEKLTDICFVKTTKDTSPGVKAEMDTVKKNGGSVFIMPAIKDPAGVGELSSTRLINEYRNRVTVGEHLVPPTEIKQIVRSLVSDAFDEETSKISPVFDRVVDEILTKLITLNTKTGLIISARDKLTRSVRDSLAERSVGQMEVIRRLANDIFREFSEEIDSKPNYACLFTGLALKLVNLDPDMIPVQYSDNDTSFGKVVGVKLASGEMVFIDPKTKKVYDPIVFESVYHKLLPQHTSFQLQGDKTGFARRMYFETEKQRNSATAMNVLHEVSSGTQNAELEIKHLASNVFKDFEIVGAKTHRPDNVEHKTPNAIENRIGQFPQIVAHGGLTSLDLPVVWAENSKESILRAINNKVDVLEIDVVPTKDGEWIASHYIDLSKISTKQGKTTDFTLEELKMIHLRGKNGLATSSTLISAADVLGFLKGSGIPIKIDVKVKDPSIVNPSSLINTLNEVGISLEEVLLTCGDATITKMFHDLEPKLPLELNTVEITNFLLANGLMKNPNMTLYFVDYLRKNVPKINARVVSLMQVAMNTWGDRVFEDLVESIHKIGCRVQVWVVSSTAEYQKNMNMGVDSVLMHDPEIIARCKELRNEGLVSE